MIIDVLGYFCCSMMIFRLNKYRIRTERMDVGSRALALADPYCQSAWNSVCLFVCLCVCLSATLRSNISETKGARRKVTIGSL